MNNGWIKFNKKESYDIDPAHPFWGDTPLYVSTFPSYEFPTRRYETLTVPGRNGVLVYDTGSFEPVTRKYICSCGKRSLNMTSGEYTNIAMKISKWVHSGSGYCELKDSYEPNVYRMAYYNEENSINNIFNQAGQIELSFTCSPERYLETLNPAIVQQDGYITLSFTNNIASVNISDYGYLPTGYTIPRSDYLLWQAHPIIKISNPSGTVKLSVENALGTREITISNVAAGTLFIDCNRQDCYVESGSSIINANPNISINSNEFPVLLPGNNTIKKVGSSGSVGVKPNWYII